MTENNLPNLEIESQITFQTKVKMLCKRLWNWVMKYSWPIGIVITLLIFIIPAYYNRPILTYNTSSRTLITTNNVQLDIANDLEVKLKGKIYTNLHLVTVELYNSGWEPADGATITNDPFRITSSCGVPLAQFTDKEYTSKSIDSSLITKDEDVIIKFNFINPGDKIVINLLYDKPCSDISMIGSTIGIDNISRQMSDRVKRYVYIGLLSLAYFIVLIFLLIRIEKRRIKRKGLVDSLKTRIDSLEKENLELKGDTGPVKKRTLTTFSMLNIPVGEEVVFIYPDNNGRPITCRVADDRRVEYLGEKLTLSALAWRLLPETGHPQGENTGINGWWCFKYEDEILAQRRLRMESEV